MTGINARPATLLVCAAALVAACSRASPAPSADGTLTATVISVTDGDTVTLRIAGRKEKVRLIGVDTPETKHPTKPVQCWGPEASAHTTELLPPGTAVEVWGDEESRDRYRRLLLYVRRVEDGLFVNLDLVKGGWAVPLPYPPNTSFASQFADAANEAEQLGLGLWGACPR
ncbi:MAG: hypothetical protein RLZZ305_455 [Actinomycetota bacterium]|jgi:micrococcal nuclease